MRLWCVLVSGFASARRASSRVRRDIDYPVASETSQGPESESGLDIEETCECEEIHWYGPWVLIYGKAKEWNGYVSVFDDTALKVETWSIHIH